jgi:ABC-2 type transport system ATP-binding protein
MMMLSGVERHAAKKLAHDELKKIHMLNLKNKSPNTFSSGQKKKILLAQALINKPNLLIMDEPVANLDPEARMEFFGLLTSLKQEGKAILISSHVLSELDLYFDSATIIDGGKIVFSGTKLELLKRLGKANYLIHSTNDTLIKKFCSTHHISHTDLNDALVINTNNLPFLTKLQAYLAKQHVTILQFSLNKISLEQVYKKMVLKGSVDTM